jgi:tetratricopeptide (TPR) repeat protein
VGQAWGLSRRNARDFYRFLSVKKTTSHSFTLVAIDRRKSPSDKIEPQFSTGSKTCHCFDRSNKHNIRTQPKSCLSPYIYLSMSQRTCFKRERSASVNKPTFLNEHDKSTPIKVKRSTTATMMFLTPRPVIVSMLNNKAVFYMERNQYAQAKKSLSRALRMTEKTDLNHNDKMGEEEGENNFEIGNMVTDNLGDISWPVVRKELACLSLMSASVESSDTSKTPFKHRAEYDEGMDYFKTPLRLSDTSPSIDGTILFNLGRVHHNQGNNDEALSLYKRSLRALENGAVCDEALTLAILFGIGQIQYIRGDHADSLKTYMMCLNFARSKSGEESLEVAACMNCIGVLHYIMPKGDSDTALQSLKTSIALRKRILGDLHIDVGTTWNNIGRIYFQQGKYDLAMDSYRKALRIRRLEQGDSVDVAATIFNIGQVNHQQGERDRALRHYQEFLKLAKKHFGEHHRDICIVTTCIGQVLHEKKDFKKSLKAFHQALKVGRAALGTVHAEIAITLNKLGNLYYETNDLESALKAYHQGLQVELTVLEPGNPNVCVTYTNIAEIHKQRSEYRKALDNYDKVLTLQRKHAADPLDVANTLSSIGYVRHQKGDYQGAMDVNQECLRIRREIKGDVDEEVASTLTHIALVLLKMDMHDMALGVLTEAYRIRTSLSKTENRDIAFTLYNIALIYHHQGSHEQALSFYRETARVEKAALGQAHRDLSITFYNIGQIYYQRGEMELAIESFQEALSIERKCFGENHPTCARTLNEIGNIELQMGNVEAVMQSYTEALRIYREAGVNDDHLVIYGRSLYRFEVVQPAAAGAA